VIIVVKFWFMQRDATQSAVNRLYASPSHPSVCLSVRPSVCDVQVYMLITQIEIGAYTVNIISRLINLRCGLRLTPLSAIWSNGNTPKNWVQCMGGGQFLCRKPAISLKRCKRGPSYYGLMGSTIRAFDSYQNQ